MSVLTCKVISEPIYMGEICMFNVQTEFETYTILSKDIQAVKDYIFVDKEQIIQLEGEIIGNTMFPVKGKLQLIKSKE